MKKPNALPTVLFDHTSIGPHSAVFDIPSQVTITAFGLQPDDYITFEALQLTPGARAFACGCVLTPAQEALIADTQQLQCPSCDSATLRPVRLTPSNPVVVLDSPQGISLRAVYHGTGLDLRSVRVIALPSDTQDLTDAMRGCPPVCCEDEPETWIANGLHRCTAAGQVELQETSNCGNTRWVECGPVEWVPTGVERCGETAYYQEERNQCGHLRWAEVEAIAWTDTGMQRCGAENIEVQQVNQCGRLRWTAGPALAWEDTGEIRCTAVGVEHRQTNQCGAARWFSAAAIAWTPTGQVNCQQDQLYREERNQCGETRWADTGAPCVPACVPDWQNTGETRCTATNIEARQLDGCGNEQWHDTGVAVVWSPNGPTECGPEGTLLQPQINQCGGTRMFDTGTTCSTPCVPNWQNTGVTRCTNVNVENQQNDGCGNTRWFDTGVPVAWTNNGATICGGGGTLLQPQINPCGGTRWHDTGTSCVDPCVPTWVNTGTTRCTGTNVEAYQEDGCGNTRWHDTGTPVAWTDNGGRQCADGFYQRNETNPCGATRWANIAAIAWTNTGVQRCTGTFIENQQSNQCGTLRWEATAIAVAWSDTGVMDCSGANLMAQQVNQCGTTRMDDRGPVTWTNTGAPTCVDGTLRQLQTNPCGGTRTVDTGTACGPVAPSLPASFGGACFVDSPTASLSYYQITFGTDGTGVEKIQFGGGSAPFTWAPGTVNGADYQIKVDFTFSGASTSYNGPANGAWVSLATARTMEWRVSGPGANAANLTGAVSIRRVGASAAETTAAIGDTFISVGVECP